MSSPVFITARFRTGSTLLWNIFHQIPEANTYYEPCHEKLPEMIRADTPPQATHFNVDTYFREYPPVDEMAQHHTQALGVYRLFLEAADTYSDLDAWIRYLLDYAYSLDKKPVFQFNRIDFRLPWIKTNFPEAKLIHLYRSPRDQWLSSIADYPGPIEEDLDADPYLITTWARDLCNRFPFLAADFIRHPYQRHYYLWKLSYLAGSRLADFSLSYEDLLSNPRDMVSRLLELAEFQVESNLDRCLKIIVQRPTAKWPQYNTEEWFADLENECEAVLDDLGLNQLFGTKPLAAIVAASSQYQTSLDDPRAQEWARRNSQTTIVYWETIADEKETVLSALKVTLDEHDKLWEELQAAHAALQAEADNRQRLIDSLQATAEERLTLVEQHRQLIVEREHYIQALEKQLAGQRQLAAKLHNFAVFNAFYWLDKGLKRYFGRIYSAVGRPIKKVQSRLRLARRPKLGRFHQYPPRPLDIPSHYVQSAAVTTPRPRISIVTPSYNQAAFIEQTIRSVLDQNYPDLDYIIQDGASKDDTVAILERYRSKLSHLESSKDKGQTNALNLGFAKSDGEIMAYLNSDDLLLPGSLHYVARYFVTHPQVDVVYGHRVIVDENGMEIGRWIMPRHSNSVLAWADYLPQETMFWRRSLWEACGGYFDESFNFAMDWELLLRFCRAGARFVRLPRFLGAFRVHSHQKTTANILDLGQQEMSRLRKEAHGREVTQAEIEQAIHPYIRQHVLYHSLYRLGILRY
jgi:hypothetical protein